MIRRQAALRGAVLAATGGAIAPEALAGAWSQPAGATQSIVSVSREDGDFGESWRIDSFNDYGFGDGWGVTLKAETQIRIDDLYDERSGWRIGAQKAFAIGERGSVSVNVAYLAGESLDGVECEGDGYEVRAAAGTSFSFLGREGFVTVEAGQRNRNDCRRSVLEFASGWEIAPDWSVGVKAWQEGGGETGSAKAELSLQYNLGFARVGAGWRREISGNFKEDGWVVSARFDY